MKKTLTLLTFILIAWHQSAFCQQSASTPPVSQKTIIIPIPGGNPDTLIVSEGVEERFFTRVDKPAYYFGGDSAWTAALNSVFEANQQALKIDLGNSIRSCQLKILVNYDGSIISVEPMTLNYSRMVKILIDFIRTGPKWHPAVVNKKHAVKAYGMIKVDYPVVVTE